MSPSTSPDSRPAARIPRAILLIMLFGFGCTREIREQDLFFPQPLGPAPREEGRKDIRIPVDASVTLGGWYFYSPDRNTTLLYFYGNGESTHASLPRAHWLIEKLGVNVLIVDYRGYGYSGGSPGVDALLEDAVRAYDAVAPNSDTPQRIVVFGRSIGTAAAVHVAAHREIHALLLEAPFTTLNDVVRHWDAGIRGPAGWFVTLKPEQKLAERNPQPVDLIREIRVPSLFIHGDADSIIPLPLGKAMYDACAADEKTWCEVPGVGHNNLFLNHPRIAAAVTTFAHTHFPTPPSTTP